jgi:serine/threonine-protein kinase
MTLQPGEIVDRFRVERVLGEGGQAVVYQVSHVELGGMHALKVLTHTSTSVRRRLLQEGRAQSMLGHINIVGVTDVVMVGGSPGLVMDFVDGPTLE